MVLVEATCARVETKKTSALQSCNLNGCSNFQANNLLPLKCNFPKEWKSPSFPSHLHPIPNLHPPQTRDFGPPWGLPSISQAQNHVTLLFHCRKIAILQGHLPIQKPFPSQVLRSTRPPENPGSVPPFLNENLMTGNCRISSDGFCLVFGFIGKLVGNKVSDSRSNGRASKDSHPGNFGTVVKFPLTKNSGNLKTGEFSCQFWGEVNIKLRRLEKTVICMALGKKQDSIWTSSRFHNSCLCARAKNYLKIVIELHKLQANCLPKSHRCLFTLPPRLNPKPNDLGTEQH